MKHGGSILEVHTRNSWTPPSIEMHEMADTMRNDPNALKRSWYLHIFQTDTYIDSILIEYDIERNPKRIVRLPIHEDYTWDPKSESLFHEYCVKNDACSYQGGKLEEIYKVYDKLHPEWHLQRYYTKGLRLIDHIYNCVIKNSVREMLYKAGLDELAVHTDELDEINLMAKKPSELYDGLTMKVLRSINCTDGAALVNTAERRAFIKELNQKFPAAFAEKLNDAQCRYLGFLIKGQLTVGETGRLFTARKSALNNVYTKSMFEIWGCGQNPGHFDI